MKIKWGKTESSLFHSLGFASLGSALLLQMLVFYSILTEGKFIGVEPNNIILFTELAFTAYGITYLCILYKKQLNKTTGDINWQARVRLEDAVCDASSR